jgi:hypothetical protein
MRSMTTRPLKSAPVGSTMEARFPLQSALKRLGVTSQNKAHSSSALHTGAASRSIAISSTELLFLRATPQLPVATCRSPDLLPWQRLKAGVVRNDAAPRATHRMPRPCPVGQGFARLDNLDARGIASLRQARLEWREGSSSCQQATLRAKGWKRCRPNQTIRMHPRRINGSSLPP